MTTAAELGIEAVTRIVPGIHPAAGGGARKGGGTSTQGHESIPISLPRVKFLEKREPSGAEQ